MFFIVDDELKLFIAYSPKCACTSIKRWYLDCKGIRYTGGRGVHDLIGYGNTKYSSVDWHDLDKYESYHKVLVVRNPYYRLVSGYVNKYIHENMCDGYFFQNFMRFVCLLAIDRGFFFVDRHHFESQFNGPFLRLNNLGFKFTWLVKVESFDEDFSKFSSFSGFSRLVMPEHHNRTPTIDIENVNSISRCNKNDLREFGIPPYESFYNGWLRLIVRAIYRKDFSILKSLGVNYC